NMAEHNSFDERFDRLETLINAQGATFEGRFDKFDGRVDQLDSRFDKFDGRVDQLDSRFDKLDGRVDQIDSRFDKLDGRVDKVDGRFDKVEGQINTLGIRLDTVAHHVKLIAEGHGALATNIAEMKGGIERLQAGQTNLGLRMLAVELRVTDVDK